ncbi:MAG: leucine-rich repeat domain-containing protein [Oscillospiraceae bacterium]|nr:leucine-rich repeat domain-containing protein [Oscillospiraceae bacterium]
MRKILVLLAVVSLLLWAFAGCNGGKDEGPVVDNSIVVIDGEEYDVGETKLNLSRKALTDDDIEPLARMSDLESLDLRVNYISDLTPLTELVFLTRLDANMNDITSVAPLAELYRLERLDLAYNLIRDLRPLEKLTRLETLYLSSNQIDDVRPLMGLTRLKNLYLNDNPIPEDMYDVLRDALPNTKIHF